MCLAIPGKIVEWLERDELFARAWVEFGGVRRQVSLECVPEAEVGDFVLVHAGIAISRIDPDEAAEVLSTLEAMEAAEEQLTDASAERKELT